MKKRGASADHAGLRNASSSFRPALQDTQYQYSSFIVAGN
jgi:hypothetical protein